MLEVNQGLEVKHRRGEGRYALGEVLDLDFLKLFGRTDQGMPFPGSVFAHTFVEEAGAEHDVMIGEEESTWSG